jgi:hypothetical protein
MTLDQFKRSKRVEAVANQLVTKTGRHEMNFVCPTDEQEAFIRRESHPP